MIRTEAEYREAVSRIDEEKTRIQTERARLEQQGLSNDEVDRVMAGFISFHMQLEDEVTAYEKLSRGDFGELRNFRGLGRWMIGFRIFSGLSQRELADRLGVSETQVSRDERNEYHNITIDRATRILEAMGVELKTTVDETPPRRELSMV